METNPHILKVRDLGIDTYRENIVYLREDSEICRSEGFSALTRVVVKHRDKRIVATLNVVYSSLLHHNEAGLSKEAMKRLDVTEKDTIEISHLKPIESFSKVRAKMYGRELTDKDFSEIITDVVSGHYSNIQLAALITACSSNNLNVTEIIGLTKAMIETSEKINWGTEMVLDKHCVGGLPGNRTTPILVSIVAEAGLTIPKTSSRAITSPAGTADTLEMITRVDLSTELIKTVVEKEKGCLAWGGAVKLSPADDILISVERALNLDSTGQLVASVLSKKAAAGSTHVLIDIPMGETAKVRSQEEALHLQYLFKAVAEKIGLQVEPIITDGSQPIGRGIGPSLEAIDVLSVLRNEPDAPADLREKSLQLAAALLELSGKFVKGTGYGVAQDILHSGRAYNKFKAICEAQGGFKEPALANFSHHVLAQHDGVITRIDNRKLARIAKLAGAPRSPLAGIRFLAPLGKQVKTGDILFSIYAESTGELAFASEYIKNNNHSIEIK